MNRGLLQRWPKRTFKERFEDKIYYSIDGCWYWIGCINEHGYGEISIGNNRKSLSSRASYSIYRGEIPQGLFVCHCCDNPACVNPNHLFLGTHIDNMRDMIIKGRQPNKNGSNNPNAKLSRNDILIIKNSNREKGESHRLAKQFNVSRTTIYNVWSGRQWSDVLVSEEAKLLFQKV